jgi:hypothetical protein
MRINRQEVVAKAQELFSGGGCLVLKGNEMSGKGQALSLVEELLTIEGFTCMRMLLTRRSWTPQLALGEVLHRLQTPGIGYAIHPGSVLAGLPDREVVDTLLEAIDRCKQDLALLFEDVDQDQSGNMHRLKVFDNLAEQGRIPVVVTCGQSTRWPSVGSAAVLRLGDFSVQDVRICLNGAHELSSRHANELEEAIKLVFGGPVRSGMRVSPATAYFRLQAWSLS